MSDEDRPRRRFPRIASEHTVLVRPLQGETAERFAKTRVVGLGGCMFVSEEAVGVEAILELLIAVGLRVVRVVARVVYEIPHADGGFEVGVEFLEVSPFDRAVVESLFAEDAAGPTS